MIEYVWTNVVYNKNNKTNAFNKAWEEGSDYYGKTIFIDSQDPNPESIWLQKVFNSLGLSFEYVGDIYIGSSTNPYITIERSSTTFYIKYIGPLHYTSALKFKNSNGGVVKTFYKTWVDEEEVYPVSEKGDWIYFNDVGYGMDARYTYQYNYNTLDDKIESQFPHIKDSVVIKNGPGVYNANFTMEDKISSDGGEISGDNLRLSGVTKTPIPDYKISSDVSEKHFEILNFPQNRISMTENDKKQGQFSFGNGFQQDNSSNKTNPKYFGAIPQVYPEVVFNATNNNDLNKEGKLKSHQINYIVGNKLIFDGKEYNLHSNDEVVFYIREQGNYTPNSQPTLDNLIIPIDVNLELKNLDIDITSSLYFNNMGVYARQTGLDMNFTLENNYLGYFKQNESDKTLHKKIIKTYGNTVGSNPIAMPPITGASYSLSSNKKNITAIGYYNYNKNNNNEISNVILKNAVTYNNKCMIDNLQYIGVTPSCYENQTTYAYPSIPTYISSNEWSHKIDFYSEASWIVGCFPPIIGYFKDCDDTIDVSSPSVTNVESVVVNNTEYKYYRWHWTAIGSTSIDRINKNVELQIGYKNKIQKDTFALAVVIWRNGKLVNDEPILPGDDEPIPPSGGGIVVRPVE